MIPLSRAEPRPTRRKLVLRILTLILPTLLFGVFLVYKGGVDAVLTCRRTAPGTVSIQLDHARYWGFVRGRVVFEGIRFASPWSRLEEVRDPRYAIRRVLLVDAQRQERFIPDWLGLSEVEQLELVDHMNTFIRGGRDDSLRIPYRTRNLYHRFGLFLCLITFPMLLNTLRWLVFPPKPG